MKMTLYNLVAAKAETHKNKTAILGFNHVMFNYDHLYQQVTHIGQQLHQLGLCRYSRIALVLPNGVEAAIAFISVASHMICAPLNPNYSQHEFDFYLTDLRADALVVMEDSQSSAIAVANKHHIPIFYLSRFANDTSQLLGLTTSWRETQPLEYTSPEPHDIALLLHTSGTTSRPKLVPLTHANLCASANHIQQTLRLTSQDRCLNVMPLFHIHGLLASLLASLIAGSSIFCVNEFNPDYFINWLGEYHPTWYSAVPTIHQSIIHHLKIQNTVNIHHRLRFIRSSSAALPTQLLEQLERLFNVPVIEAYGMTEAAHQMASNPLPPTLRKAGSVGLAAGPKIAILDRLGNKLPVMHVGEIAIRGDNVFSGYADNPDANSSAFHEGWFRTGDQGYLDQEGYLYINGRLKEIINRGGEKISPREIDDVLLSHFSVAQAVTFALPHPTLGETVAAAVKLQPGGIADEQTLQRFAAHYLAPFKVPDRIVFVAEIPKGATGKLQRIGLAEKLGLSIANLPLKTQAYVAPRSSIESRIAEIWEVVLAIAPISIHDHFLDLRGDSIRAIQIITRIRQEFNIEISQQILLTQPTIAEMALTILKHQITLLDSNLTEMILTDIEGDMTP